MMYRRWLVLLLSAVVTGCALFFPAPPPAPPPIREYRALELALKGTEENYRLQRDEYKRNLVSNLDVLEALESLIETRREASRLLYETKQNYWRLKIATGVCCESL